MTIPAYREVDLALLLELVRRQDAVRPSEIYADVARHFPNLSDNDLAKTRPDGRKKVFQNIVQWARDHLRVRALLADTPSGVWKANDEAGAALKADLLQRRLSAAKVDPFIESAESLASVLGPKWAKEVRQHRPKRLGRKGAKRNTEAVLESETLQEDETIETSGMDAVKELLLNRLNQMDGYEFEQFVGRLLDSLGFLDTQIVGRSGDEGIDVITNLASPFLTAKVVVQVKRHSANVGPKDVSYLRDRWSHRADKLLFITTSDYTAGAREVAGEDREKKVDLVNGEQLVEVMVDHQLGVRATPVLSYGLDEEYLTNL